MLVLMHFAEYCYTVQECDARNDEQRNKSREHNLLIYKKEIPL